MSTNTDSDGAEVRKGRAMAETRSTPDRRSGAR